MALKDIIRRIESDTESEAGKILAEAQREAETLLEIARNQAAFASRERIEKATREAEAQAGAIAATARLRARDAMIAEKRVYLGRVLREAVKRLEALPDDEYAAILARETIGILRGGDECVEIGRHDADRIKEYISDALRDAGFNVSIDVVDSAEKGIVVQGERTHAEISVAALAQERRATLEAIAADCLFGEKRGLS